MDEYNTVTYLFADGTKQISRINPQVMFNEKGRRRSAEEVRRVFETSMYDLGAISFEL